MSCAASLGGPPAWVLMWTLAVALGMALKGLTLWDALRGGTRPPLGRALGYLLAWPGMDARRFFADGSAPSRVRRGEGTLALAKTLLGITLVWGLAPWARRASPDLGAWIGMIGVALTLHFGAFHILSVLWRRAGVDAPPIMDAPLRSRSLAEFWGVRWNRAFSDVARRFVLRGVARRWGVYAGTLAVFLASGLVHELVISVPAGGGYGLPTAYFGLQGAAVLAERTRAARRIGLGSRFGGRIFAIAVTTAPAFWLLHTPFVRNVILPMLDAIGAA